MSTTSKRRQGDANAKNEELKPSLWQKAFNSESQWDDKDEFLDVIYWMRQLTGLALGLIWGLVPLKGLLGLILFVAINVAIVYYFFNSFHSVDEEQFGGVSEILKEGLMTSFATFLVSWIIIFSALHS